MEPDQIARELGEITEALRGIRREQEALWREYRARNEALEQVRSALAEVRAEVHTLSHGQKIRVAVWAAIVGGFASLFGDVILHRFLK